jgi:hypothetical protein
MPILRRRQPMNIVRETPVTTRPRPRPSPRSHRPPSAGCLAEERCCIGAAHVELPFIEHGEPVLCPSLCRRHKPCSGLGPIRPGLRSARPWRVSRQRPGPNSYVRCAFWVASPEPILNPERASRCPECASTRQPGSPGRVRNVSGCAGGHALGWRHAGCAAASAAPRDGHACRGATHAQGGQGARRIAGLVRRPHPVRRSALLEWGRLGTSAYGRR